MLKKLKKRKLRFDILTIFITIFITALCIIIYNTYTRSTAAVLKVGNDLIEQRHQSVIASLDHFLRPIPFTKVAGLLLNDGELDQPDAESLSDFMHIMLESYPQLINMYLTDTHGNIFIETLIPENKNETIPIPFINTKLIPKDTKYISEFITNVNNHALLTIHYKNKKGVVFKTDRVATTFDPRTRPWFIGAKNLKMEPWVGIYNFLGSGKHGMTLAFPIVINKQFKGVAASDLRMHMIEEYLNNYSKLGKDAVFIVNNHGKIIAARTSTATISNDFPSIQEINNPLLIDAYNRYIHNNQTNFTFNHNHTNYTAHFTPYAVSPGEQWAIASIIPVDTFVEPIKLANEYNLIFSIIMFTLGLILVIFFAHQVSRPIMRLADKTKEIIKLEFTKKIHIKSTIYEVQVMTEALQAAQSALSSFAKYVPKTLVRRLLESNIGSAIGGEKNTITILFTDITNFTTLAEEIDPEVLVLHISDYLNRLTQLIQNYQGIIDKYIGDAIMAFWNTPIQDPNHVLHACQATLACRAAVREMNQRWAMQGKPLLPTRFGLHTGEAIVGNIGSSDRLNYTALGDTVNLAARLETCNKTYETEIIVSHAIYQHCRDEFVFRPIDVVKVKGKQQSVIIYELMGSKPGFEFSATEDQIKLSELSIVAYEAYQKQEFSKARELFKKILQEFPEDSIARMYLKRCEGS